MNALAILANPCGRRGTGRGERLDLFDQPAPAGGNRFVHTGRRDAFSLVEVVTAIGVLSFAFLAILGLLTAGNQSSRRAAEATSSMLALQALQAQLRTTSFSATTNRISSAPYFWFTENGGFLTNTAGLTVPDGAFYRCGLQINANPGISSNQASVAASLAYPPPAFSRTNIFVLSVRDYGANY